MTDANRATENGLSYDALVMLLVDVQDGNFQPEPIVDALRELIDRRADERVAATLASVEDRHRSTEPGSAIPEIGSQNAPAGPRHRTSKQCCEQTFENGLSMGFLEREELRAEIERLRAELEEEKRSTECCRAAEAQDEPRQRPKWLADALAGSSVETARDPVALPIENVLATVKTLLFSQRRRFWAYLELCLRRSDGDDGESFRIAWPDGFLHLGREEFNGALAHARPPEKTDGIQYSGTVKDDTGTYDLKDWGSMKASGRHCPKCDRTVIQGCNYCACPYPLPAGNGTVLNNEDSK